MEFPGAIISLPSVIPMILGVAGRRVQTLLNTMRAPFLNTACQSGIILSRHSRAASGTTRLRRRRNRSEKS